MEVTHVALAGSERAWPAEVERTGKRPDPAAPLDVTIVVRGPVADDLLAVQRFATDYDLLVLESDVARRSIRVRGSIAQLERAFDVRFEMGTAGGAPRRLREGTIAIPYDLADTIADVLGLEERA